MDSDSNQPEDPLFLLATVGVRARPVLASLDARENVQGLIVFCRPDSESVVGLLREACRVRDVSLKVVVVDPGSSLDAVPVMRRAAHRLNGARTLWNVTGGDKHLTNGAILSCVLEGAPAVMVHDTTGLEVPLPLLSKNYGARLSPAVRRVLAYVSDHPGVTQTELKDALGLSYPTIGHHVATLVDHGLVSRAVDPRDQRRSMLTAIATASWLAIGPD